VRARGITRPVIVLVLVSSWIAGTAAQMSGVLSDGSVDVGLAVALLLFHQRLSIPVALWATVPILLAAVLLRRRLSAGAVAAISLGIAVVALAVSSGLVVLASLPGPLDTGNWAATLPRDLTSLVAFHLAPWLTLAASVLAARPTPAPAGQDSSPDD
jgi:hypothetical protein